MLIYYLLGGQIKNYKFDMSQIRFCIQLLDSKEKRTLDYAVTNPLLSEKEFGRLNITELEPRQSLVRSFSYLLPC